MTNKKNKNNRIRCIVFVLIAMLVVSFGATGNVFAVEDNAPKTVTKQETFITSSKPFNYGGYSKTIRQNGHTYTFSDISYTQLSTTGGETKTKSFTNLTSRSVPATQTFKINGKSRVFKLSGTPTYKESKPTKIRATRTYDNVIPGKESSVIKSSISQSATRNGKKVTITLSKKDQSYESKVKKFSRDKTLSAGASKTVGGIDLTTPIQNQSGYKQKLKDYYELPEEYKISSAYFRSDIFEDDGVYYRDVHFQGTGELRDYKVVYEEPSASVQRYTTYSATAKYVDNDVSYKVRANITYTLDEDSNSSNSNKNDTKNNNKEKSNNGNSINRNNDGGVDDGVPELTLTGETKSDDSASNGEPEVVVKKNKVNSLLAGLLTLSVIILLSVLAIFKRDALKSFYQNHIVKFFKKLVRKIRIIKHNIKK